MGTAAMGGLGFYVVDISDPNDMSVVGHLPLEPNIAGVEGDFVDVSQVSESGIVYMSGYPLNEDCWEPYKDLFMIDVMDPANPRLIGTLPRPAPPADAGFTDYCQRRGSFGPKRSGAYHQPGVSRDGLLPFNFYNAGVQVFDVSDTEDPEIAAYFVPRFDEGRVVSYAMGNLSHSIYVEYDRKPDLVVYQSWNVRVVESVAGCTKPSRTGCTVAAAKLSIETSVVDPLATERVTTHSKSYG